VPVDVSESILVTAARALRRDYPRLEVHGIVGDYEHHLRHLPASPCRLAVFLGSTIGNFSAAEGAAFLGALSSQLRAGDMLLIGFDLVKSVDVLNAAYNDSAGVTAQFNRNVLRVLNRELDGDFDLDLFDHDAFFNTDEAQIEMHLRSRQVQKAHLQAIDLEVSFAAGESIRTEISRKFTRATAEDLLCQGGFAPLEWNASANDYFALALAEVQSP
jgi:L-histidine N-alpha-methyltransferase